MKNILDFAKLLLLEHLNHDSVVVDATVGNGNDTEFLCKNFKFTYGFDIQKAAIEKTSKRLKDNDFENFKLILDSHENVLNYVSKIDGAIFNLGYLPTSDKSIITNYHSTIAAISNMMSIMNSDGILVIVVYTQHDLGKEAMHIEEYLKTIPKHYSVLKYEFINKNSAPYIIAIGTQDE